jgi:hypothetical protein
MLHEALSQTFAGNQWLLGRAVDGFTWADWRREVPGANPPRWIVGHLAWARRGMLRQLAVDLPTLPWEEHFRRGSRQDAAPAALGGDELMAAFRATDAPLIQRLRALDAAALAGPAPAPTPSGETTLAGWLRFAGWHETYHIGQVGLWRRWLGKAGVI